MTEWLTLMTVNKDTGLWWHLHEMLLACCVFSGEVAEELRVRHGYFGSGHRALGSSCGQLPPAGIRCMPLHPIF